MTDWAGPGGMGTSTVSRGSENMTTWFVAGSIETVIIVSVLWAPSCSSAPMSRMFRRSLPSHGGSALFVGAGASLLIGDSPGTGEEPGPPLQFVAPGSNTQAAVP